MLQHIKECFTPTAPAHAANASFLAFTFWSQHTFNVILQSAQLLAAVGSFVVTVLTIYRLIGKIKKDKHEKIPPVPNK